MTLPDFQNTEAMRIALSQGGTIPNAVLYNNGKGLWDALSSSIGGIQLYGSFFDTTDQPLISTASSQVVTINSAFGSNGVSVVSGSRITFSAPGTYNLTYVAQVSNLANSVENAAFWLKFNGVDYANSTTEVSLLPRKSAGVPSTQLVTVSFTGTSTAVGDYVQLYWSGTSTLLSLQYDAPHTSPVVYPATPSVIVSVIPVSSISTGAPGPSGSGTPIGPAGGGLTGSYPNPTLAPNSVSSSNIVDGSIGIDDLGTSARPWGRYVMYNSWGSGQYQQTTASFTVPTRSTCIFTFSSSAYVQAVSTYAFFWAVDGITGWTEWTRYFHNNTFDHRTYPTGFGNLNLNAGTYTLRFLSASGQYTDFNDYATASVAGYPY